MFAAAALALAALAIPALWPARPYLLWNASASSPVGLYWIAASSPVARGDMVAAWPPAQVRSLASRRGYLPSGIPLVKTVAAVAGDTICSVGPLLLVNGRPAAVRLAADPSRRPLPRWSGCEALGEGDLFLLSDASPDSFDGRYFGASHQGDIIGKARLLWRG